VRGVNLKNSAYDVYKEGALKPTPSPALVRRFTGDGGWHDTCAGIIGLTKMDWKPSSGGKKNPNCCFGAGPGPRRRRPGGADFGRAASGK
jgi:hypothetical protein